MRIASNNPGTQTQPTTSTVKTYNNGNGHHACDGETHELPPYDENAEWFLIASLSAKPSVIPAIDSGIFYLLASRDCFLEMSNAWKSRMFCTDTREAFLHYLGRRMPAANFSRLDKAVGELPSSENWSYWHGVVMDCYKARCLEQLKPKITEVSQQVARGGRPDEILFEIQKISRIWHNSKTRTISELMPEVQDFLEYARLNPGRYPGESTGFANFDRLICGLQKGKHYVIGGRPGHGKTSLIACMALGLARRDVPAGIISLEMLGAEIVGRMVSSESRVPLVHFTRGNASDEHVHTVAGMMAEVHALPLFIADELRTLPEIILAMHEQAAMGVKVIFVDYLQKILINRFRGNRNELVTEISGTMKELSITLRLPVVSAAQLNRDSEKDNREPTMADLRDSGAIEQDADFVALLHNRGKGRDPEYDGAEITDLIIGKNRSGETGRQTMAFRKEIFRFDEI